jgi:hypothetical protein
MADNCQTRHRGKRIEDSLPPTPPSSEMPSALEGLGETKQATGKVGGKTGVPAEVKGDAASYSFFTVANPQTRLRPEAIRALARLLLFSPHDNNDEHNSL